MKNCLLFNDFFFFAFPWVTPGHKNSTNGHGKTDQGILNSRSAGQFSCIETRFVAKVSILN